ncbi:MAG TPA: oxygen-independent coproporphyrinogen III oxidase, partial [Chlamydiales bacterium]|nr:oxygen-independent coproporphyrinogen III oxidase [Chlamydiales bacterium]
MQTNDLISVDPVWLEKWNRSVPRYTSYPTAPQFQVLQSDTILTSFSAFGAADKPLSIYIHIPFCKSMCLFCGCSVILNRRPERAESYLELLLREIELVAGAFRRQKRISQLHIGGGTPTSLEEEQLTRLMFALRQRFLFEESAEISIEVDPRTVYADQAHKLAVLKMLGFNRISFGVQDLDPKVQEAVKRRQSEEMTLTTFAHAKKLGFQGINIDLIYGLPLQTPESFRRTADILSDLKPDRISLFSYAKVPWLKPHQNAIREEDLPSSLEKFQIYAETRRTFMEAGFVAIGMDHFALPEDSMAAAYREEKLTRNFQGYSVEAAEDMLGLGVSSIGYMSGVYLQNVKTLEEYESRIMNGRLPVLRGFALKSEDLLRRWV